jgi:hypothetical protein
MANNTTPLSITEKYHYTNVWCKSMGMKSKDLGCGIKQNADGSFTDNQLAHPQIDDVILLIKFHQANWHYMTRSERGVWAAYWSWCYHNQTAIKAKWFKKLEHITESVIIRQQALEEKRKAIQRKRNENRGVHMTANPPLATSSLIGT